MAVWSDLFEEYRNLITSADWDSRYLREQGLIPNVLELIGDCRGKDVLDVGTGTGWLFEHIHPKSAHACDVVRPETLPEGVAFKQEDVRSLSYRSNTFDVVVASLLLIYCSDLRTIVRELHRVAAEHGVLVISLMHPYFYRAGEIQPDGSFLITEDLSCERKFEFRIGEHVGPFTYFYRPLPVYLNSLIAADWRIVEVRDWFIDMNEYLHQRGKGVKSKVHRSGKVPLYAFIKAIKE